MEHAAPEFSGVVVAQVLTLNPHPDADKLRVASVDSGHGEPLQIVCGAPNVAVGVKVPLATIGAVLPGDLRIKNPNCAAWNRSACCALRANWD